MNEFVTTSESRTVTAHEIFNTIVDDTKIIYLTTLNKNLPEDALRAAYGNDDLYNRDVLRLRFGLDDGQCRTLEEVGQIFGVTRERIRQIEAKALRKLRHPSRSRKLKDFLTD